MKVLEGGVPGAYDNKGFWPTDYFTCLNAPVKTVHYWFSSKIINTVVVLADWRDSYGFSNDDRDATLKIKLFNSNSDDFLDDLEDPTVGTDWLSLQKERNTQIIDLSPNNE